jgi:hypothetical protein
VLKAGAVAVVGVVVVVRVVVVVGVVVRVVVRVVVVVEAVVVVEVVIVVVVVVVVVAEAVVVVGVVVVVEAVVVARAAVTLARRFCKALTIAVEHWFSKISQTRSRYAMSLKAEAACVRARRKKEVVVRRMNFIVGKDWRRVDEQVLYSLL